jgi:hypothetical protein
MADATHLVSTDGWADDPLTWFVVRETPRGDPLGVDADDRVRSSDRFGRSSNLDRSGMPWVRARQVVDDNCCSSTSSNIAELLGLLELAPADVNRVLLAVVAKADGDDMRRPVVADRRDAGQAALACEVRELWLCEGAHLTPLL